MTQYVNVPLSKTLYRRLKKLAEARQQDVGATIAEHLTQTLASESAQSDLSVTLEKEAFKQLHPQLKVQFPNQYVAIYQGKLIDHDEEYGRLFERIDANYPDTFVWMTRVEAEAEPVLQHRSLRFVDA